MGEHPSDFVPLLWAAGWLLAVLALFWGGLRLPLETRLGPWAARLYAAGVVLAAVGAAALANVALVLHDGYLDVTREKTYTPSPAAMRVVDALDRPVAVTYFFHAQDPSGKRARDILEVMAHRNPLFRFRAIDPDKEPTLARTNGIRIYNAAIIEAEGRRVLVQSSDEAEIALGIQRALRDRVITICFLEGHGELPMDNFEFHTHLEGIADHSHGDASSKVVEMPGHGVGRFRRALEAQGYEARKVVLATSAGVPKDCAAAISASPRATFLPGESAALRAYLRRGGSALFLFDLGFVLEPGLETLMADLGVRVEQEVVVDPLSHYQTDPEMVAVAGYDPHPVTRSASLTFYPGARPLSLTPPAPRMKAVPLLTSSRDSYARPVQPVEARLAAGAVARSDADTAAPPVPGSRVLGVAAEGSLDGGAPLRAIVIGDADFASNSFFPYMSNSDLLLSAVRWLVREDRGVAVRTRVPVPPLILLTGAQQQVVFGLLVVLLPFAIVGLGCFVWWRRR
jgi:gliding motility-associatede transport system auxiliary component